jgi:hypothetical protein
LGNAAERITKINLARQDGLVCSLGVGEQLIEENRVLTAAVTALYESFLFCRKDLVTVGAIGGLDELGNQRRKDPVQAARY